MTDTSTSPRAIASATRSARRVAAALLVAAAVLFGVGVAAEHDSHAGITETNPGAETQAREATKQTEQNHTEEAETVEPRHETVENRQILGIDAESPAAVALAGVVSVVLAAGLWATGRRGIAWAVVAFGIVFALFDAIEVTHQIDESRSGLALLAAVIASGHVAAAGAAGWATAREH